MYTRISAFFLLLDFYYGGERLLERHSSSSTIVAPRQYTELQQLYQPTHYTAEQSLAEPGSIPLESRQWLFPFKAATFSTVLGGKEKMANSKGGITYRVCSSFCLSMYYMYVHCFSISQPNACTLAFTFPPLGSMCVCTYTHTHRGTLYVPLQTSCIVKENCEFLKNNWREF